MATNSLSGLVSGFDWKTFIDSTIEYGSAPITRMQKEQTTNNAKNTALSTLDGKMTMLQNAIAALAANTSFYTRTASLTGASSWSVSAGTGADLGSYAINVTQLATTSRLRGSPDISAGLAATSDVSGTTLSTLPMSATPTSGFFTINGRQITIDATDSLQDAFEAISTATGGAVTASYDPVVDKVILSSAGTITLGAANDTSNFLTAFRLSNNGAGSVSSSSALATLPLTSPIGSVNLRTPVTAVDGSGNGSFSINGVSISYNTGTDSLKTIIARINASTAGVTASYDTALDRVVLTNKSTGDTGIFIDEAAGGLLDSLGLTGSTVERGTNALFSVNGGPELVSASNTLSSATHGIDGLGITVNATGSATVNVASDTSSMKTKINAFISAFNDVQSFIEQQSKVTSANGKVTTSTLSDEREVQSWSQTLRRNVFAAVDGLPGAISRLESLGIDFTSGTNELALKNSAKLDQALANTPDDVAAFFTTSGTGFAARLKSAVDLIAGTELSKGYIDERQTKLTASNKSLDDQIAAVQRQLDQQRELLTASFIAMENAQSTYNNMQTQLTKAFSSDSSK